MSGASIASAAGISTKNIDQRSQNAQPQRQMSISDIANMDVSNAQKSQAKPPANSLAAKAGAVAQYNEEHPEEMAAVKRKYKK